MWNGVSGMEICKYMRIGIEYRRMVSGMQYERMGYQVWICVLYFSAVDGLKRRQVQAFDAMTTEGIAFSFYHRLPH